MKQLAARPNEYLQEALVNAIALNMHTFYTGTERIFTEIATTLPDLRPAVISEEVLEQLDELRLFRHVVRSSTGGLAIRASD